MQPLQAVTRQSAGSPTTQGGIEIEAKPMVSRSVNRLKSGFLMDLLVSYGETCCSIGKLNVTEPGLKQGARGPNLGVHCINIDLIKLCRNN